MFCDLHTHSTASDGTDSPSQIIRKAKELGITVALTDHDTVRGLPEFFEEANALGVAAVAGAELTTEYDHREIHLIGLFIEPLYYNRVGEFTHKYRVMKMQHHIEMTNRLRAAGYLIDYESVKARGTDGNINRTHFAEELIHKGYVSSVDEAFDTILAEKFGFYINSPRIPTLEAIDFFREIHALPIIAHPLKDLSENELRALLPPAIERGLCGMETLHSDYSADDCRLAAEIAAEFSLLQSGGSDYHGFKKPTISLGRGKGSLYVPIEFYNKLSQAKSKI